MTTNISQASSAAHTVDRILFVLAFAVPVFCVVRYNFRGTLVGAFFFWIILLLAGPVSSGFDPERHATVVDGVWLLFGWVAGFLYAFALYGLKLYSSSRSKYKRNP
jgi:hypothetical protein